MKTNAVRQLDQLGIPYELREYEVEPDHLEAETVAAKIGLPAEQVFKTLVARGDRTGVLLAVVPGDAELDLKPPAAPVPGGFMHIATTVACAGVLLLRLLEKRQIAANVKY